MKQTAEGEKKREKENISRSHGEEDERLRRKWDLEGRKEMRGCKVRNRELRTRRPNCSENRIQELRGNRKGAGRNEGKSREARFPRGTSLSAYRKQGSPVEG